MLYSLLKWLHVLLAMIAVGANITYGLWIRQAARNPQNLPFVLRGLKFVDDRVANPAYILLLITGLAMVWVGGLSLTTPWILLSLILYGAVATIGLAGYTPTLRRQIELLETYGPQSPEYLGLARRGTALGIITAILIVAIVFLMVTKPTLGM
ncbi:MAG: DUF2269 family protein [Chloroflexi bacterium]|nr:DUF2269 family protein [Chloroflexota bacterium]